MSGKVIAAALEVHRAIGPGMLESVYEACLRHELRARGVEFRTQVPVSVSYKGLSLDCGHRMDLLVEEELIVELKAVRAIDDVHLAQLLTYLRCTGKPLGLLINFNVPLLKHGIRRIANNARKTPPGR